MTVIVAQAAEMLVSSCTLAIVHNLSRGGRSFGVIENVVTHADYRRLGLGGRVLAHALDVAWQADRYKVLLATGSKRETTLRFYEGAGFLSLSGRMEFDWRSFEMGLFARFTCLRHDGTAEDLAQTARDVLRSRNEGELVSGMLRQRRPSDPKQLKDFEASPEVTPRGIVLRSKDIEAPGWVNTNLPMHELVKSLQTPGQATGDRPQRADTVCPSLTIMNAVRRPKSLGWATWQGDLLDFRSGSRARQPLGEILRSVRYFAVVDGTWPDGHRHDRVHEVDHAVELGMCSGARVILQWEMDGLDERLSIDIQPAGEPRPNPVGTPVDVSRHADWRAFVGQSIIDVVPAWHIPNEGCQSMPCAFRFVFEGAGSIVVALGEFVGETMKYQPDALLVIFDQALAE